MALKSFLFTLALGLGYASYVTSSPDKECASVPSMSCEDVDVPVTEEKVERKCETVYNDVCNTVTETEHREECRTKYDRKYHTQDDGSFVERVQFEARGTVLQYPEDGM